MPADHLSATFAALADPTRRAILARLASGERSVSELARPFAMSLPAVSKHLKVLEHAGLIARSREAQRRPCRLEAARLKEVADWVDRYRRFWEESFDRLDEYLRTLQTQEKKHARKHAKIRRDADAAERTLTITRTFDAPRELVFALWTDPAHAKHWMGPRGFTATHFAQDARPGGAWRACLREDDSGRELWQGGVIREIVPPARLVYTFAWDRDDGSRGHETLVTITFAEQDGKTRMTFHQTEFESVPQRDGHRGGWSSSFDRLAEYVAAVAPT